MVGVLAAHISGRALIHAMDSSGVSRSAFPTVVLDGAVTCAFPFPPAPEPKLDRRLSHGSAVPSRDGPAPHGREFVCAQNRFGEEFQLQRSRPVSAEKS